MAHENEESATPTTEVPDEIVIDADEIVVEEAPTSASATATAPLTDEKAESPVGAERVVYVSAPVPPKPHSNRVAGILLALAGAVVFVLLYGLAGAAYIALIGPGPAFGDFVTDAVFWIPVLLFTLSFLLVVVLLNRAGWWVHVLGSLLVAVITYLGSIAMLLLVTGIAGSSPGFLATATSPFVIAAAIIAREVSIWTGLLISRRGAKVRERNRAERDAFEAEHGTANGRKASDGAGAAAA